jgi:subfamily B ATP-binding cassette protein MsbA
MRSLRDQIAVVTQETYLFDETIRNNISYGVRRKVSDMEIIEAAKAANAHDFIMSFPDGYETTVGERAARLSGGQKQRIAIARALLKNVPILILDEATSSLDTEAEREVQKALSALMEGRTTLVIAHRLSTVRKANNIVVIEDGQIVERGKHDDLISARGIYSRLYELQFAAEDAALLRPGNSAGSTTQC